MKKHQEKMEEAKDLQNYYVSQVKEQVARKKVEQDEEREYVKKNKSLLKVLMLKIPILSSCDYFHTFLTRWRKLNTRNMPKA